VLNSVPTVVFPFLFAIVAAVAAALLARSDRDQPAGFASKILYAVAIGCVIIGIATWWLQHA
jgi:FtsH-binding integral membrane protein